MVCLFAACLVLLPFHDIPSSIRLKALWDPDSQRGIFTQGKRSRCVNLSPFRTANPLRLCYSKQSVDGVCSESHTRNQ